MTIPTETPSPEPNFFAPYLDRVALNPALSKEDLLKLKDVLINPPDEVTAGLVELLERPGQRVELETRRDDSNPEGELRLGIRVSEARLLETGCIYSAEPVELANREPLEIVTVATLNAGSLTGGDYPAFSQEEPDVETQRTNRAQFLADLREGNLSHIHILNLQDLPNDPSLFKEIAALGYDVITQVSMTHPGSEFPDAVMAILINRRLVNAQVVQIDTIPHYQFDPEGTSNGPCDWTFSNGSGIELHKPSKSLFVGQTLGTTLKVGNEHIRVQNIYISPITNYELRKVNLEAAVAKQPRSGAALLFSALLGDTNTRGKMVSEVDKLFGVVKSIKLKLAAALVPLLVLGKNTFSINEVRSHNKSLEQFGWTIANLREQKVEPTLEPKLSRLPAPVRMVFRLLSRRVTWVTDLAIIPLAQSSKVEVKPLKFSDHKAVTLSAMLPRAVLQN